MAAQTYASTTTPATITGGPRHSAVRSRRRHVDESHRALALALYVTAALVLTVSLWRDPTHQEVAGNPHDTDLYTWWLAWISHGISSGHLSLLTRAMNAPAGVNSMWNTSLILPGIVLSPVTLLAGAQLSYNILLFIGFVGSAYAAHRLLLRHADVGWWPAIVGGALFGFSPAMVHAAIGHVSLEFMALAPLLVSAALDIARRRVAPIAGGFRLGALAAAQLLIGEEVLFDTAIVTAVLLGLLALVEHRAAVHALAPTGTAMWAALTLFITLVGYPLWIQIHGPLTQHGSPLLTDYVKSDLLAFVTPSSSMLFHTGHSAATALSISPNREEYLGYLGWPILGIFAVALVTMWRSIVVRVAGLIALLTMTFSLGAHLKVHGHQTHVPLPWLLVEHLPLSSNVAVARFALLTPLAVGAVVAVLLTKLRPLPILATVIALVAVVPVLPLPLKTDAATATPSEVRQAVTHIPKGSTVLVLPFPTASFTDPLRWQSDTAFRFAMPGGYFIGPAWDDRGYIGGDVPRQTTQLLEQIADGTHSAQLSSAERQQATTDFSYWHVSAVLLGPGPGHDALATAVKSVLGSPSESVGPAVVWLCDSTRNGVLTRVSCQSAQG